MNSGLISRSFVGFLFVGILTVLTNLITFQALISLSVDIYLATFLGNLVSVVVNFTGLSNNFDAGYKVKVLTKYTLSLFLYYFITIFLLSLFLNFGLSPIESRTLALFILTPLNYLAQKSIVFK